MKSKSVAFADSCLADSHTSDLGAWPAAASALLFAITADTNASVVVVASPSSSSSSANASTVHMRSACRSLLLCGR